MHDCQMCKGTGKVEFSIDTRAAKGITRDTILALDSKLSVKEKCAALNISHFTYYYHMNGYKAHRKNQKRIKHERN